MTLQRCTNCGAPGQTGTCRYCDVPLVDPIEPFRRLEYVELLLARGCINPEEARAFVDFPGLE